MKYSSLYGPGDVVAYKDPDRQERIRYAQIVEVKFDEKKMPYYLFSDLEAYQHSHGYLINPWVAETFVIKIYRESYLVEAVE